MMITETRGIEITKEMNIMADNQTTVVQDGMITVVIRATAAMASGIQKIIETGVVGMGDIRVAGTIILVEEETHTGDNQDTGGDINHLYGMGAAFVQFYVLLVAWS
jgi:hypothetical protein